MTEANPLDPLPTCPDCGSTRQARIVYGMVEFTDEVREQLENGSLFLGGCCVTGRDPEWRCLDCWCKWGISRQTRQLLELAGSGGSKSTLPTSIGGRIVFWSLYVLLFVPVIVPLFVGFRVMPALFRIGARCLRFLRRGRA